jgi:hypothetical protein
MFPVVSLEKPMPMTQLLILKDEDGASNPVYFTPPADMDPDDGVLLGNAAVKVAASKADKEGMDNGQVRQEVCRTLLELGFTECTHEVQVAELQYWDTAEEPDVQEAAMVSARRASQRIAEVTAQVKLRP